MKNLILLKLILFAGVFIFLIGLNTTAFCQDDYEGQFVFQSVTKGYEYNAPDFIGVSKYDGDKATVYRQRTGQWGMTTEMVQVSPGVFEYGFGREGFDKTKGERVTFLSLNKLVFESTFRGVKAIYIRKKK